VDHQPELRQPGGREHGTDEVGKIGRREHDQGVDDPPDAGDDQRGTEQPREHLRPAHEDAEGEQPEADEDPGEPVAVVVQVEQGAASAPRHRRSRTRWRPTRRWPPAGRRGGTRGSSGSCRPRPRRTSTWRSPSRGRPHGLLRAGDDGDLSPTLAATVHRLAREAVTNAVRHTPNANRVDVHVTDDAERVCLTVADDGAFGTAEPVANGFGLTGMRERTALFGGTLTAGPAPGGCWRRSRAPGRTPQRPRWPSR
jgi:hypothetical protein